LHMLVTPMLNEFILFIFFQKQKGRTLTSRPFVYYRVELN